MLQFFKYQFTHIDKYRQCVEVMTKKGFPQKLPIDDTDYCLITINYRAVAHGDYLLTGISDFIFASLNLLNKKYL